MNNALRLEDRNNKGIPSEMCSAHKPHEMLCAHNVLPSCPIVLIICKEHGSSIPGSVQNIEAI